MELECDLDFDFEGKKKPGMITEVTDETMNESGKEEKPELPKKPVFLF